MLNNGDRVVCINNEEVENKLTKGQHYIVEKYRPKDSFESAMVEVVTDKGRGFWFFEDRFAPVGKGISVTVEVLY